MTPTSTNYRVHQLTETVRELTKIVEFLLNRDQWTSCSEINHHKRKVDEIKRILNPNG